MKNRIAHNTVRHDRLKEFIAAPKKAVWMLALPMIASFSTQTVYVIVDQIFIGRLGASALAASTFISALFFLVTAVSLGFSTGVSAAVSRAVGRQDKREANRLAMDSVVMGLYLGITIAALCLIFGKSIIPILGARGDTATAAWNYLSVLGGSIVFMFLSAAIRAVFIGEGNTQVPMMTVFVATIINLGLDPIFMFVLGLGIRGAALATVVAELVSFVLFVHVAFRRQRSFVNFRTVNANFIPSTLFPSVLMEIGLPTTLALLIKSLGSMLNNRLISEFGQPAVAGYGAGSKVDLIVVLPIIALSSAVLTLVNMLDAAGRRDLIRVVIRHVIVSATLITAAIGMAAFLSSSWVIGLFTTDQNAFAVGKTYVQYMAFAYPLMAFGIVVGRVLQGLGHGCAPLFINAFRLLLIGVPAAWAAVCFCSAPIQFIWISMIVGAVAADLFAATRLYRSIRARSSPVLTNNNAVSYG